nr:ubiquitin hydrolase [Tanacetum cinerariifolium]
MWYQSLVRSFDQEKNNIQAQQKKKMVKSSSSSENEPFCSKSCKKNTDSLNGKITDLEDKLFNAKNMIYHYKLGLAQVEARLAEQRDRELKYCKKIKGLEYKTESSDEYIEILKKKLDLIKKEKEGLDSKLTGFQTSSKDLESLLESQRFDKNKEGLGYSAVPPPLAQIYSSPKKDLSWTGLLEFADDTVTDYSRPAPTVESSPDDAPNRNPSVTATKASPSTITSKDAIKFVKVAERPTTDKVETTKKPAIKYAELYRKTTKRSTVRGNQRNWNNLKSQQLRENFVMKNKACFNCGHFDHLSYNCGLGVKM